MTLVDPQHPLSHSISACSSRAEDRRLLRRAAAAAILVHFGLLLVPLPAISLPPPSKQRESPVFITKTRFDPPPIERRSPETVRHTERRRPIPVPAAPDRILEPSVEPVELTRTQEAPFDPAFILDPVPAASVSLGPLGQDTAGLVLPVAVPGRARPEYPRAGRRARLEGTVVLKAVIDKDGDVVSIHVVSRPTADVGFSDAAVAAVRQWRYTPGQYGGEPVAVEITVVVQFVLE